MGINHLTVSVFLISLGDSYCFLFSIKPKMGVYHPTGYNENFMYLNMGMQTMPNGLVSSVELFKLRHTDNSFNLSFPITDLSFDRSIPPCVHPL